MSDLILFKAWNLLQRAGWMRLSRVCQNSKGGFPAVSSSQLAGILILTKIGDSSPLIPLFPLQLISQYLFLFSASGPQQDNCFNINHSHTPCQTHGSERQSKKNKRARYSRWILNNSIEPDNYCTALHWSLRFHTAVTNTDTNITIELEFDSYACNSIQFQSWFGTDSVRHIR